MAVKLPCDLEEEILSRVPFRSLARLRSVCKLWNSLILDERLIEKYLSRMHRYRYSGEHQFISRNDGLFCSVGIEEQQNLVDPPSLIIKDITLRKVRPEDDNAITVYRIVTCDGLLLCVMENQLMVWNPLLKETSWIKCGSDFHIYDDAYSLGYLGPCDYRILRFRCAINSKNRPPRVEVCQVASKTWKVITTISFDWFLRVPLSTISLRGTPYWIGLREDHTAFLQSFDFSEERFQPLGHLPFRYDELNPIALEIFKGDRLSVVEQCHKTRKICIWVKHWLILAWTRLVVVDTPHFPLLYPHLSRLSTNYFFDKNNILIITSFGIDGMYINRVTSEKNFQATEASVGQNGLYSFMCNYASSLVRIPGFSKQDTCRIRWRKKRFN